MFYCISFLHVTLNLVRTNKINLNCRSRLTATPTEPSGTQPTMRLIILPQTKTGSLPPRTQAKTGDLPTKTRMELGKQHRLRPGNLTSPTKMKTGNLPTRTRMKAGKMSSSTNKPGNLPIRMMPGNRPNPIRFNQNLETWNQPSLARIRLGQHLINVLVEKVMSGLNLDRQTIGRLFKPIMIRLGIIHICIFS